MTRRLLKAIVLAAASLSFSMGIVHYFFVPVDVLPWGIVLGIYALVLVIVMKEIR